MKTDTPHCHACWSTFAWRGFFHLLLLASSLFAPIAIAFAEPAASCAQLSPAKLGDGQVGKAGSLPEPEAGSWWSKIVVDTEYDLYYTSVGLHIPLTNAPILDLGNASELEVYRHLFFNSLNPSFLLLEASVFPMPLAGVALKEFTPGFYRAAGIGDDFNLIESITTGFPEPYAASIFVGDIVDFTKKGEKRTGANKGYMGYLFSYSNQHIRRNTLIYDNNYELEWKLKGERNFLDDHLSWSFRIGAKLHENPHIQDALYLGIRRNNLSYNAPFLAWLDNSNLQMRLDFSKSGLNLLRQEYIIGKSYPIKKWQKALTLDIGLIWESPDLYRGRLRHLDRSGLTAVLRPQIAF